jgi:hypothetical protein
MNYLRTKTFFFFIFVFCLPFTSTGEILTEDTVWSGEVSLDEDVLVPENVTLTVLPGTIINIQPSDRTKTGPEYLSSLTEIIVRGRLEIDGKKGRPVLFHVKGNVPSNGWAGIIVDGGTADIKSCTIQDAETGKRLLCE